MRRLTQQTDVEIIYLLLLDEYAIYMTQWSMLVEFVVYYFHLVCLKKITKNARWILNMKDLSYEAVLFSPLLPQGTIVISHQSVPPMPCEL